LGTIKILLGIKGINDASERRVRKNRSLEINKWRQRFFRRYYLFDFVDSIAMPKWLF